MHINDQEIVLPAANHYVHQFERFSQAVLAGADLPHCSSDAVRQAKVVASVLASMETGQPQSI